MLTRVHIYVYVCIYIYINILVHAFIDTCMNTEPCKFPRTGLEQRQVPEYIFRHVASLLGCRCYDSGTLRQVRC